MVELKTWSFVINWDDDDAEQGTYGQTVRAATYEKAERIVRARMIWSHWENHWDREIETRRESLSSYFDGSQYFGMVVESQQGATWKASELESALRALRQVAVYDDDTDRAAFDAAMAKADAVLADIDAL